MTSRSPSNRQRAGDVSPVPGDARRLYGKDLQAATDFLRSISDVTPPVGIILGSGLGGLADKIEDAVAVPFSDIPGFATATAGGHRGQLILGTLESVRVVAMAGRFHRYEGWSNDDVAFPVVVMSALGTSQLIVSNAAGGLTTRLRVGDIVVIRDHVNLMGGYFGFNRNRSIAQSLRCHCSSDPNATYDRPMSQIAMDVAIANRFNAYEGTYLATLGPTYETRTEYRMMRRFGADVVGMSTIPEVLTASNLGMRVLGLSMVSNVANPDQPTQADHAEVLEAGRAAEVKMEAIVRGVLRSN